MEWIAKVIDVNRSQLATAIGVAGENNSITWEVQIEKDSELTLAELKALAKGGCANYVRAKAVKRYMVKGFKCREIVMMLRKDYSERSVKGDHAILNKLTLKK